MMATKHSPSILATLSAYARNERAVGCFAVDARRRSEKACIRRALIEIVTPGRNAWVLTDKGRAVLAEHQA